MGRGWNDSLKLIQSISYGIKSSAYRSSQRQGSYIKSYNGDILNQTENSTTR